MIKNFLSTSPSKASVTPTVQLMFIDDMAPAQRALGAIKGIGGAWAWRALRWSLVGACLVAGSGFSPQDFSYGLSSGLRPLSMGESFAPSDALVHALIGDSNNDAPSQTIVPAHRVLSYSALSNLTDRQFQHRLTSDLGFQLNRSCLAEALYYEGRGEPIKGQIAIAQVILRRANLRRYPDSICHVVYQRQVRSVCQFSFACQNDGNGRIKSERAAWRRAQALAHAILIEKINPYQSKGSLIVRHALNLRDGKEPYKSWHGATHFHAVHVSPTWSAAPSMLKLGRVGSHIFYRERLPSRIPKLDATRVALMDAVVLDEVIALGPINDAQPNLPSAG